MPKAKYSRYKVVGVGQESDREVLRMLEEADQDAKSEGAEVRVNFRWGAEQLALLKEAARVQGLPYQIYIKKALYDRAKADLVDHARLQELRRARIQRAPVEKADRVRGR